GDVSLPPDEAQAMWDPAGQRPAAPDGKFYSRFQSLPALLALPFYLAGREAASVVGWQYRGFLTRAAVTGLSAVATAGTALLLASIGLELGLQLGQAAGLGLLFGLTTIAWPYSKYFWAEPVAAFFLLLAVFAAVRIARSPDAMLGWLWPGLALALAVSAKSAVLVSLAGFELYLLWPLRTKPSRRLLARIGISHLLFWGSFAVLAGVLAYFGFVRVGSVQAALSVYGGEAASATGAAAADGGSPLGSGNLGVGLYGLLLSPGKSLFLYSPILLATAVAFWRFVRWQPRLAVLSAAVVGANVAAAAL